MLGDSVTIGALEDCWSGVEAVVRHGGVGVTAIGLEEEGAPCSKPPSLQLSMGLMSFLLKVVKVYEYRVQ